MMDPVMDIIAELKAGMDDALRSGHVPPPPDFDEEAYLQQNPDVAEAVVSGAFPSGFVHYFQLGYREGRRRPPRLTGRL